MAVFSVILCSLSLLLAGCQAPGPKKLARESAVDAQVAGAQLPAGAPSAGPDEPQQGFHQEVRESQNP